ncbi:hypothetical protein, variant [Aphanomyces astaci]|uniref:MIR domain-containing protein n=1 Tax=Aphanomyces astaci TaxID=112090 RepID=W4GU52_APHAT|nr:hypothetical protein, variant [Aphanomyces astaci]ETV82851.1 hypothetical protein, variant [Aphanomyces astaci]|eukprot:XP_009827522.1 hypothetical protein, variant [Aphanomyces astaci]
MPGSAIATRRKSNVVYEGDIMYLAIDGDDGNVHSDGFVDEGLTALGNANNLHGEGCLFKILPKLSYEAHKALRHATVVPGSEKHVLLTQQVKVEVEANASIVARIGTGAGQPVVFGQPIQLQHVVSGKFLTSHSKALADMDKSCMKVSLQAHGSSKSWFTFIPRYRHRVIGQPLTFQETVCLVRSKSHSLYVHLSRSVNGHGEVNVHHKATDMKLVSYHSSRRATTTTTGLRFGKLYRLYHVEGKAFVALSANPSSEQAVTKPPYLRYIVPDSAYVDDVNMTVKSMFVLERSSNPLEGGDLVEFASPIRFRHLVTGRYLAVAIDPPAIETEVNVEHMQDKQTVLRLHSTTRQDAGTAFYLTPSGGDSQTVYRIETQARGGVKYRLHNPNRPKPNRSGKATASGHVVATTDLSDQDVFHLVEVAEADVHDTHLLLSVTTHLRHHFNLQDALDRGNSVSFESMKIPLTALRLLLAFFGGQSAASIKPASTSNSTDHHHTQRQDKARQVKLIDTLFAMLRVVPANHLDMSQIAVNPRRRVIHRLHQLINTVLEHLLRENVANKHYITTRSVVSPTSPSSSATTYLDEIMHAIGSETGAKRVYCRAFENNVDLLEHRVNMRLVAASFRRLQDKGVRAMGMLPFLATICSCHGRTIPANQELIARALYSIDPDVPFARYNLVVEVASCAATDRCFITNSMKSMALTIPQCMESHGIDWKPPGHEMAEQGARNIAISWKSCSGWQPGANALYHAPEELGLPLELTAVVSEDLAQYRLSYLSPELLFMEQNQGVAALDGDSDPSIPSIFDTFSMKNLIEPTVPHANKTGEKMKPSEVLQATTTCEKSEGLQLVLIGGSASTRTPEPYEPNNASKADTARATESTPSVPHTGPKWVLLEHIAWTLQPQTLYPLLFNINKKDMIPWSELEAKMPRTTRDHFIRLRDLAQYFQLQLDLLVELVRGGSASSIQVVTRQFSYTMLLGAISNERLPHCLRTAFGLLMHHCYVHVFPHEPIVSGSRVFVYEDIPKLNTKRHTTLPCTAFQLDAGHPAVAIGLATKDDFLSYPHPNKLSVLQAVLFSIVAKFSATPVHQLTVESTAFLRALLHMLHDLLRFGFYADVDMQKRLVGLLMGLLDGRNTGTLHDDQRYRRTPLHDAMTTTKSQICHILSTLHTMWRDIEVTRVMSFFKHVYLEPTSKWSAALHKKRHGVVRVSDVVKLLDDPSLDLLVLSNGTLDFICVDLIMYDDKVLVHEAMKLMIQANTRREQVLRAVMDCLLVYSSPPSRGASVGGLKASPGYHVFKELRGMLPTLKYNVSLAQSPAMTADLAAVLTTLRAMVVQLTGCCVDTSPTGLSVPLGGSRKSSFWGMVTPVSTTRHKFPNYEKQRVVLHLRVHEQVIPLLQLQARDDVATELAAVQAAVCDFLTHLVQQHPAGQHAIFKHLPTLWPRFDDVSGMGDVLIALLMHNATLCKNLPEEAMWKMVRILDGHCQRLARRPDRAAAPITSKGHRGSPTSESFQVVCQIFDFVMVYMAPNEMPCASNQRLWLDVFTHAQFTHTVPPFAAGIEYWMDVLSDEIIESAGYRALVDAVQSPDQPHQLHYFQKVLVLMGLSCRGRNLPCEVKCQQTYPLNLILTLLLDAKMPMGLKYVASRYLTLVFLHADGFTELTSLQSPMWRLLMQSSNTIADFAASNSQRFLYRSDDRNFQDLYSEYVYFGLLDVVTCFFARVFRPAAHHIHVDGQITAIRTALATALAALAERSAADAAQSKVCHNCRVAVGLVESTSGTFSTTAAGRGRVLRRDDSAKLQMQSSPYDRFKLELSVDDAIQATLTSEFHALIRRWEAIDIERHSHSSNVTQRLFCTKIIEFVEANPTSGCVVDALKILHELCAKHHVSADDKKVMAEVDVEEAMDKHTTMQTFLASCGAARMVVHVIATSSRAPVVLCAIRLASELLYGGNIDVQTLVIDSLVARQDDRFFVQVDKLLRHEIDRVKEARRLTKLMGEVRPEFRRRGSEITSSQKPKATVTTSRPLMGGSPHAVGDDDHNVSADLVIQFLTQCAKGHFRRMQTAMLTQSGLGHPSTVKNVNILASVVAFMSILVKDELTLASLPLEDGESLVQCWAFLAVYMQGPCKENQEYLLQSSPMVELFRKTLKVHLVVPLTAHPVDNDGVQIVVEKLLKGHATKAMVSALEGRMTSASITRLCSGLEVGAIKRRLVEIHEQFQLEKDKHVQDVTWDERFLEEGLDLITLAKVAFGASFDVADMPMRVKRVNFVSEDAYVVAKRAWQESMRFYTAHAFFASMHHSVEIWWGADIGIETVYFALPSHCRMLACLGPKKDRLLNELNYKSNDRLKQFVKATYGFDQEMQHMEVLSTFKLYNVVRPYIPHFKTASFFLAISMNVIMVVAVARDDTRTHFIMKPQPLFDAQTVMGNFQVFFSLCVLMFILVISVPLVFRRRWNVRTKHAMLEYKLHRSIGSLDSVLDLDELKIQVEVRVEQSRVWWAHLHASYGTFGKLICLVLLLQFTLMQATPNLPSWLPVALLMLPFIQSTRMYLENGSGYGAFIFTALYDVVLDKYTAFYFFYFAISVGGLIVHPFMYMFHLFDIVMMSPTLQNVVASVTKPGRVLLLTTLLGLCGIYFFAMLLFFAQPTDAVDQVNHVAYCKTLMDCFALCVHRGIPHIGGVGYILSDGFHNPPQFLDRTHYWSRIVYDVAFFAFAVIMLNMIFGITVDTFSDLRTDSADRAELKMNQCFVCGQARAVFDNHYIQRGLPNGFQKHIDEEHNMWHYMYFLVHVNSKHLIECNGPEAYVKKLLVKEDLSWFPQGKAACLDATNTRQSVKDDLVQIKSQLQSLGLQSEVVADLFQRKRDSKAKNATRAV